MTRAPGSIDNELHKSEKNRKKNNAVLHFPSVLPIAGYHMRRQRQNRENLAAMPFSQISIDYFVTSLCWEFLRCCSLVVGVISLITAVIRSENYANQSLETKNSGFVLRIIPCIFKLSNWVSRFTKCFSHIIFIT